MNANSQEQARQPFPGCKDSSCSALAFRSAARRLTVIPEYKAAATPVLNWFTRRELEGERKSDETEVWFEFGCLISLKL